jgi:dual specificity phosphatase 3
LTTSAANWHRLLCHVTPQLVLTGDLAHDRNDARQQLAQWSQAGVTHIVDVRSEDDDEWFVHLHAPHIDYVWLGVDDDGAPRHDHWFDTGVDHILEAWRNPAARVLVHCQMGMNRGPSMGYAAMLATGWDPVDALVTIRAARPIATTIYAPDAVTWWLTRNLTPASQVIAETDRVCAFLDANPTYLTWITPELDAVEVR